jgi:hypothetical protein
VRAVIYFTATEEMALAVSAEVYAPNMMVLIISSVSFFQRGIDCAVRVRSGTEIQTYPLHHLLDLL